MNWDQLTLSPSKRSSSSNPVKLMSSSILLKLSFIVSKTRPSVSDRLVKFPIGSSFEHRLAECCTKVGELVKGPGVMSGDLLFSSCCGDSNRGASWNGGLLKPSKSRLSLKGVRVVPGGNLTGLKSGRPPSLLNEVTLHGSDPPAWGVVRTGLLGVDDTGSLINFSLIGVLKGQVSWALLRSVGCSRA